MKLYIARQPILNTDMTVYGYELLYRDGERNSFQSEVDGDIVTRRVVSNAVVNFGMTSLVDDKFAFINFTKSLLLSEFPLLLAPDKLAVEILETVKVDDELIERLKLLKERGYILALDDYTGDARFDSILEYIDIVKVDFQLVQAKECSEIRKNPVLQGKLFLAEKLEDEESFNQAKQMGYTLFQGYYFSKPMVLSKDSAEINSGIYMQALREVREQTLNYDTLAKIVKNDINLTYLLLRHINTLNYYRKFRVNSIKQALIRLGEHELSRWFLVMMLEDVCSAKSRESIKIALIRASFCEKLVEKMKQEMLGDEAFIMGLFSAIDIVREETLVTILENVCLSERVKAALLQEDNELKRVLDLAIAYEKGEWPLVCDFANIYQIDAECIAKSYADAIFYADEAFHISA